MKRFVFLKGMLRLLPSVIFYLFDLFEVHNLLITSLFRNVWRGIMYECILTNGSEFSNHEKVKNLPRYFNKMMLILMLLSYY